MALTDRNDADNTKVSRAEIETLCLLDAIGDRGCCMCDVPERLGFSAALTQPTNAAIEQLVNSGHIERRDEKLVLTDAGFGYVIERVSRLRDKTAGTTAQDLRRPS